jgi:hypothetical protein
MARRSTFALGFAAAMSQLLCALTGRGRTGLAVAALIVIVTACSSGSRQAPCPTNVPQSGSACPAEGATCGYLADASACEGSVDCDCDVGVWTGGPTCVVPPGLPRGPASGWRCLQLRQPNLLLRRQFERRGRRRRLLVAVRNLGPAHLAGGVPREPARSRQRLCSRRQLRLRLRGAIRRMLRLHGVRLQQRCMDLRVL